MNERNISIHTYIYILYIYIFKINKFVVAKGFINIRKRYINNHQPGSIVCHCQVIIISCRKHR